MIVSGNPIQPAEILVRGVYWNSLPFQQLSSGYFFSRAPGSDVVLDFRGFARTCIAVRT